MDGSIEWLQAYGTNVTKRPSSKIVDVSVRSFRFGGGLKDISTLARARNEILKALLEPHYQKVDLVVMLDSDLCHLWDVDHMV